MDTSKWGLWLGLTALILTVPLAVVGNLLTPVVKNWWAERSVASAKKRLEALKKNLEKLERRPPISEGEEMVLAALVWGAVIASMVFATLMGYTLGWLDSVSVHLRWPPVPFVLLLGHAFPVYVGFGYCLFVIPLLWMLEQRGPTNRARISRNVAKLEERLAPATDGTRVARA